MASTLVLTSALFTHALVTFDEPAVPTVQTPQSDELERRGFSREQLDVEPTLRQAHFSFWPSVPAYAAKND